MTETIVETFKEVSPLAHNYIRECAILVGTGFKTYGEMTLAHNLFNLGRDKIQKENARARQKTQHT